MFDFVAVFGLWFVVCGLWFVMGGGVERSVKLALQPNH